MANADTKADDTERVKKELTAKRIKSPVRSKDLLSTGSTLLNLACTDRVTGGFPKGKYILLVGDSDSGKTFVSMTGFAEAARNPAFDDYRFIVDAPEDGMAMDVGYFFGKDAAKRLEPMAGTWSDPDWSDTAEKFYNRLDGKFRDGKPFICVLDSENALSDEAELKHIDKKSRTKKSGEPLADKGTYNVAKPKIHSSRLRIARNKCRQTGSILIIISQTRDRIGFGSQFDPKTRSGGRALKFFADLEIWLAAKKNLTVEYAKDRKRQQGIVTEARVKKNRITGKKRTVDFPIYWSHGIDDAGSLVEYLVSEGHWTGTDARVVAPEFKYDGKRDVLIESIETNDLLPELQGIVAKVWKDIDDACAVNRKRRYS